MHNFSIILLCYVHPSMSMGVDKRGPNFTYPQSLTYKYKYVLTIFLPSSILELPFIQITLILDYIVPLLLKTSTSVIYSAPDSSVQCTDKNENVSLIKLCFDCIWYFFFKTVIFDVQTIIQSCMNHCSTSKNIQFHSE